MNINSNSSVNKLIIATKTIIFPFVKRNKVGRIMLNVLREFQTEIAEQRKAQWANCEFWWSVCTVTVLRKIERDG